MGKNVLIVAASPRKDGNSDLLCGEFGRGAKEAGNSVETVFLREKKIEYCIACEACVKNGGSCIKKDDMSGLLEKMVGADVIAMATPVYFYAMDGQMKTFIDRTVARYQELSNKSFYFIATAADPDARALERTIEEFRGFTDCLNGAVEKGAILGAGVWAKGDVRAKPAMKEAYDAGKNV